MVEAVARERGSVGGVLAEDEVLEPLDLDPVENRKLLKHLRTERDALFTFLRHPAVPATHWWAEQAIRPAVVTRKACGGNRNWAGAHVQEILASVLRTARQQRRDPLAILAERVCLPQPAVATILAPPHLPRSARTGLPTAPV